MMKNLAIGLLILALAVAALQLSARRNDSKGDSGKLRVVTSFYPLYFFSQQIGGEKADVTNITPAGTEPHDYEPTAEDMGNIENSRIVVLLGNGLEAWSDEIKQNVDQTKTLIVVTGEGLIDGSDPHVWLSPPLAKQMVNKIATSFMTSDPANASYYQSNAESLRARLSELDNAYRSGLNNCVSKNIITSHAAFGYLSSAYGLNQVTIAGLSPDAEPSPKRLADIAKFAKDNNIKYIFFESLVSPKLSDTIATEVGAQIMVLDPIERLTRADVNQGDNYFTKMQTNLNNLETALQCKK